MEIEMETEAEDFKTRYVDQGANIRTLRQILGLKQETVAKGMGMTQQALSRLEQSPVIKEPTLTKIAEILNVSPKIIQEMENHPTSIVIENNTFQPGSSNTGIVERDNNDNRTIHPMEKVIELSKENASLFERLLAIEKEKITYLEQLLKEKK